MLTALKATSREQARQRVEEYIERNNYGAAERYDVDAIVDACHTTVGGWDFSALTREKIRKIIYLRFYGRTEASTFRAGDLEKMRLLPGERPVW
jgi:hypothetical protein